MFPLLQLATICQSNKRLETVCRGSTISAENMSDTDLFNFDDADNVIF